MPRFRMAVVCWLMGLGMRAAEALAPVTRPHPPMASPAAVAVMAEQVPTAVPARSVAQRTIVHLSRSAPEAAEEQGTESHPTPSVERVGESYLCPPAALCAWMVESRPTAAPELGKEAAAAAVDRSC